MRPAQTLATLSPKHTKTVKGHLTAIYKAVGCANARQFLVWYFTGAKQPKVVELPQ